MNLLYIVTGSLVGLLVGLTGMGGGSLMTPALILLAGVRPTIAVGSDLAYSAVMKAVGAFQHRRAGNVDGKLALRLAAGSIPGGLTGVGCIHLLEARFGDAAQHMGPTAWRRVSCSCGPYPHTKPSGFGTWPLRG